MFNRIFSDLALTFTYTFIIFTDDYIYIYLYVYMHNIKKHNFKMQAIKKYPPSRSSEYKFKETHLDDHLNGDPLHNIT